MGYRLTCHYDEKSAIIDPRLNVALMVPNDATPAKEWNIPFSAHALDLVMVYAHKWMAEHVYNHPVTTYEDAEKRVLDTSRTEYFARVNRRGRTDAEVQEKTAMTRLIVAAARHGLEITPSFDLVKKE